MKVHGPWGPGWGTRPKAGPDAFFSFRRLRLRLIGPRPGPWSLLFFFFYSKGPGAWSWARVSGPGPFRPYLIQRKKACQDQYLLHTLQKIVSQIPPGPDWSNFIPPVGPFSRPLRVASPCIGISGGGWALHHMQVKHTIVNAYDLVDGYREYLTQTCLSHGMSLTDIFLNLGNAAGDLTQVSLKSLQEVML